MTNLQDIIFNHPATQKQNGIYVETGCSNGMDGSSTLRLEKERDWSGILLDAAPAAMELCKRNRSPNNIFVTGALSSPDRDGDVVFGDFDGDSRGSIGAARWGQFRGSSANVRAVCTTMTKVLKDNKITKVDFWAVDLEGHEYPALLGMDFEYLRPTIIAVEINGDDLERIDDLLKQKGYTRTLNLSNFTKETDPNWSGSHQDWLYE